jgi:hypothetical protein
VAQFHETEPKHNFALSAIDMEIGRNVTKRMMKMQDKSETEVNLLKLLLHNAHQHMAA